MSKTHVVFFLLTALLLATIALIALPRPAAAQCGSSVSSCKNCHEVQKQKPVNTVGAWHTAHAFGDFCEFCHGGNVKAKDKAAAHAGMVDPLSDVKGSCQSCHPNDYMDRAKQYAAALGKTIGASSAPATSGVTTTTTIASISTAPPASAAPCGPAAPTGGQVIDLKYVYAGLDQANAGLNVGNIVLIGLIAATLLILGGLVWHYEHPFEHAVLIARRWLGTPVLVTTTVNGASVNVPASMVGRPELGALLPLLASHDPATVRAVTRLLSDRETGPKILKAFSRIDLQTLMALNESDQNALATLVTLAKEIKA